MLLDISLLRRSADVYDRNSLSNHLRAARFRQFEELVASLPTPLRILDVGGTNEFWENRGWAGRDDIQIFSLNLVAQEQRHENIKPLAGDATNLCRFGDRSFDIAFSNSVIEHFFTFESQCRMASEMQRIGRAFWVQTPNFWFPMEPHFHVPGWQWLPERVRVSIIRRWRCGWMGPCPDPSEARNAVGHVRLLSRSELSNMFPEATLIPERFCGFVKSWTAIGGFPRNRSISGFRDGLRD
jgi:methyltransferase family protein